MNSLQFDEIVRNELSRLGRAPESLTEDELQRLAEILKRGNQPRKDPADALLDSLRGLRLQMDLLAARREIRRFGHELDLKQRIRQVNKMTASHLESLERWGLPEGTQQEFIRSVVRSPVRSIHGRRATFTASTPTLDRHGTIVKPLGIETSRFDRNPVFLWAHDGYGGLNTPKLDHVIGKVTSHRKSAESFDIDVEFAPADSNPVAERALQLVKRGFLSAVSIGFAPIKWHREDVDGRSVMVFDKVDLLEVSLVPIGSNPEALIRPS